ncbi:hypothetical protein pdam_00025074, partial [Pocillopora damicornis]
QFTKNLTHANITCQKISHTQKEKENVLDNTINKVAEEVLSPEELEERQLKIQCYTPTEKEQHPHLYPHPILMTPSKDCTQRGCSQASARALTTPLERRDIPPKLSITLEHIVDQLDVLTQFGDNGPERLDHLTSCVCYKEKFFVTDKNNTCVKVFDERGQFLYKFWTRGVRQSKLDEVAGRNGETDGLGGIPATQPPLTTPLERRDNSPQLSITLEHIVGQLDVLTQ